LEPSHGLLRGIDGVELGDEGAEGGDENGGEVDAENQAGGKGKNNNKKKNNNDNGNGANNNGGGAKKNGNGNGEKNENDDDNGDGAKRKTKKRPNMEISKNDPLWINPEDHPDETSEKSRNVLRRPNFAVCGGSVSSRALSTNEMLEGFDQDFGKPTPTVGLDDRSRGSASPFAAPNENSQGKPMFSAERKPKHESPPSAFVRKPKSAGPPSWFMDLPDCSSAERVEMDGYSFAERVEISKMEELELFEKEAESIGNDALLEEMRLDGRDRDPTHAHVALDLGGRTTGDSNVLNVVNMMRSYRDPEFPESVIHSVHSQKHPNWLGVSKYLIMPTQHKQLEDLDTDPWVGAFGCDDDERQHIVFGEGDALTSWDIRQKVASRLMDTKKKPPSTTDLLDHYLTIVEDNKKRDPLWKEDFTHLKTGAIGGRFGEQFRRKFESLKRGGQQDLWNLWEDRVKAPAERERKQRQAMSTMELLTKCLDDGGPEGMWIENE